jgi:Copper type II ascorbate-dependent monooxygenase, C-terminal domain
MKRFVTTLLLTAEMFAAPAPTFTKDVQPIVAEKCQSCHRPGEIGPMAFMSYDQVRPWAKAIKAAVATRKMPPWFADPHYGRFENDRSLTQKEIDMIVAWADGGAKQGDPKNAPAPRSWLEGWNISKPDMVIELPVEEKIPAKGEVDYQYILVRPDFKEDVWVQMVEVRPTVPAVVHHAVVFIREPESNWLRGEIEPGKPWEAPPKRRVAETFGGGSDILTIYTPGMIPDVWRPGLAKKIRAGSDLILQMHYTANGKEAVDRTKIGLVFSKEPPKERVLTLGAVNTGFAIPPGDPEYKVEAKSPHVNSGTLLSFFPHMHLRGKSFEYRLVQPTGETETLLRVPRYDFNWQLSYKLEKPIALVPGSRIEVTAVFDNSPNNPANPDPKDTVKWGEQSWQEMMIGFYDVAVDANFDRRTFYRKRSSD